MMTRVELALARGEALKILRDFLNRERELTPTSDPTYIAEDLLAEILSDRGYPMPAEELRGSVLFYLENVKLIEYKPFRVEGSKPITLLRWRIMHDGYQVLEGNKHDPGIKVL